jgi:dTDP-4-dehydrorhamnose reductase/UDP-glucose 4-epimerase
MSAAETIVVGRNSLLAAEFAARHPDLVLRALGHAQAGESALYDGARCVVNFAFAPAFERSAYEPSLDIDARVAAEAARRGLRYVMISSRRVYAPQAQWNAAETAPATGMDDYGRNKARVEGALRGMLGERLTVLRPGNVVGYEPVAGRRRFGAYLQNQLRGEGRIRLTVNPAARRDLVPVEFFCRAVRAAVLDPKGGVFNVGAGSATSVGDAARWLIAGYGRGELVAEATQPADEFQLDSSKLKAVFGLACGADDVEQAMREIGQRLARHC